MMWGYSIYKGYSGGEQYCKHIDTSFSKSIYYKDKVYKKKVYKRYCYNKFIREKFNKEY